MALMTLETAYLEAAELDLDETVVLTLRLTPIIYVKKHPFGAVHPHYL